MDKLFAYLKGLTLIRWAGIAIKNLWPFILMFLFWPEINSLLSKIPFWNEYINTFSQYVVNLSTQLREIPFIATALNEVRSWIKPIRNRLMEFLQTL